MSSARLLTRDGVQQLIDLLWSDGWTVLGPVEQDGAIRHARLRSVTDLPIGRGDEQEPGRYRVRATGDGSLFRQAVGPSTWKSELFPARELVSGREADGAPIADETPPRLALFGVRSCDLAAVAVHDRVLASRAVVDPRYVARREATFVVAVACSDPASTCFCTSMGTGPGPTSGFDLALTELPNPRTDVVVRAGSPRGDEVLDRLTSLAASAEDVEGAEGVVRAAAAAIERRLPTDGLRDVLYAATDSARWQEVADRCLACGNCTMVCPTCFCTSSEDVTSLADGSVHRWRLWDSCFTSGHSYLHGGSVHAGTAARYRQWATHKFAAWQDQFGESGCVGCGRCLTWCPVGIDVTAELTALCNEAAAPPSKEA